MPYKFTKMIIELLSEKISVQNTIFKRPTNSTKAINIGVQKSLKRLKALFLMIRNKFNQNFERKNTPMLPNISSYVKTSFRKDT